MGLHTGDAAFRDGDFFGTSVDKAVRIMDLAHDDQVLLSEITYTLLQENFGSEFGFQHLVVAV